MVKANSPRSKLKWLSATLAFIVCGFLFVGWMILLFSNVGGKDPKDLVIDDQGQLYISESENAQVLKFNQNGDQLASFGSNGKGEGQFKKIWGPAQIAVDHQGQLYATQDDVTYLQKFDTKGIFLGKLEIGQEPRQLLIDSQNNLYVLIGEAPYLLKFDSTGHPLKSWLDQKNAQTQFGSVNGLALDSQDSLYIIDGELLKKFDKQGRLLASWAPKIALHGPMVVDNLGRIYFLSGSFDIYQFDNQGHQLAHWGGKGQSKDKFKSYIWQIALDHQNNVYALTTENGPLVVKKFDSSGHFLSQWSFGWPQAITPFLNMSGPLVGVILGFIFRLIWRWGKNEPAAPVKGESLPAWVEIGQANPRLLYDHLDLSQLAKTSQQSQSLTRGSPAGAIVIIAVIVLFIAFMIGTFIIGFDGFSFNLPLIIVGVIGLVAIGVILLFGSKLYWKARELEYQRKALVGRVLTTMPAANQALFIGSHKSSGLRSNDVTNLGLYLFFYLPLTLIMLGSFSYAWQVDWFEGWPGWLIQIFIIGGLIGTALGCLWLINHFQKEGQGKIKLNRTDMGGFQRLAWGWLTIFVVGTIGLDNLNEWINSLNRPPDIYIFYSPPSFLGIISSIAKYAFLVLGFLYIVDRWWQVGLKKGDYEQSLRRVTYLRSWCNILTFRLIQADILRMAGHFVEAEYLLQEALVKPLYLEPSYLARILAALGVLRLSQARYAESMFLLENSLKLKPNDLVSFKRLAEVYLWLYHRPERALELLDHAGKSPGKGPLLRLDKTFGELDQKMDWAWAQAQRGWLREADQLAEQVLHRVKTKIPPRRASLYLRAGQIKQLAGDNLQAQTYYTYATELDPNGIFGAEARKLAGEGLATFH